MIMGTEGKVTPGWCSGIGVGHNVEDLSPVAEPATRCSPCHVTCVCVCGLCVPVLILTYMYSSYELI